MKMVWARILVPAIEEFPGPRDWSPKLVAGRKKLQAYKALVPRTLLLSSQELKNLSSDNLMKLIEQDLAFVVKLGNQYQTACLTRHGQILMNSRLHEASQDLWKGD